MDSFNDELSNDDKEKVEESYSCKPSYCPICNYEMITANEGEPCPFCGFIVTC